MNELRKIRAEVTGRVQGVGYRAWVQRQARMLGLAGWVRNNPDGSVALEAQGEAPAIATLLRALPRGPQHAEVQEVQQTELTPELTADGARFEIHREVVR